MNICELLIITCPVFIIPDCGKLILFNIELKLLFINPITCNDVNTIISSVCKYLLCI